MGATVPQFALPLRIDASTGGFVEIEQDSPEEVAQCVTVLLATSPGTRWDFPDFGLDDPLFKIGLDEAAVQGQISRYEPRAHALITQTPGEDLSLAVQIKVEELRDESRTGLL